MSHFKPFLTRNYRFLLSVLFAIGVFSFWGYVRPAIVLERESLQLFLWNGDYFLDRMSEPGGLARYVAEFLVQFFKLITYGAVIYALLFTSVQRLTWKILRRWLPAEKHGVWAFLLTFLPSVCLWILACDIDISTTFQVAVWLLLMMATMVPRKPKIALFTLFLMIPIGYWLIGSVVVLLSLYPLSWLGMQGRKRTALCASVGLAAVLVACVFVSSRMVAYPLKIVATGIDYKYHHPQRVGSYDEMEYDYLQRRTDWAEIVRQARRQQPQTLACQNAVRLAQWQTRQIGDEELKENLRSTHKVMTGCVAALIASDTYMSMGFVNLAQRAAFEVLEGIPNYNKSGRVLARLVETSVVTGQYDLAEKYVILLKQTIFYRNWAQAMHYLIRHPEEIKNNPYYHRLQQFYNETDDVLFI